MPFKRRQRMLQRPRAVKHSGTFIETIGNGSSVANMVVLETDAGARSTTGASQVIQGNATTDETVRTADKCKLINLHIQGGARENIATPADRTGWIEWAFICVRQNENEVPVTQIGVQTLGDICTN